MAVGLRDACGGRGGSWEASATRSQYRNYLRASGRSLATIRERVGDIDRLERSIGPVLEATADQLIDYLAVRHGNSKPEYKKKIRSSLRSFYAWATERGLVDRDVARLLPAVHVPRARPHPIPDPVLINAYSQASLPVRAMLLLGGTIGLRRSEIATAHPRNRRGNRLTVLGKGAKTRIVPLDDLTVETLRDIESNQGLESFYFPGRFGGPIHPSTAYRWVRTELGNAWSLHSLRHRAATIAYRGTLDLRATQEFLGHSSPSTTQIYVEVSERALEAVVAAAAFPASQSPRAPGGSPREPTDSTIAIEKATLDDLYRLMGAIRHQTSRGMPTTAEK